MFALSFIIILMKEIILMVMFQNGVARKLGIISRNLRLNVKLTEYSRINSGLFDIYDSMNSDSIVLRFW